MAIEREKLDFDAFLERELFHLYQEAHSDAKKFWSSRRPIDEAKDAIKKMLVAHYAPKPAVPGDGKQSLVDGLNTTKLRRVLNELHFQSIAHLDGSHSSDDNHVTDAETIIMQLFASEAAAAQTDANLDDILYRELDGMEPTRIADIASLVWAWHTAQTAHPFIEGLRCPACSSMGTIFVANGNYLTCSLDTCPNPDYAEAAAAAQERAEPQQVGNGNSPVIKAGGEKALWVTERAQVPSGEWRIVAWLNTNRSDLSNEIHRKIADLVKREMESALAAQPKEPKEGA